MQKRKIPQRKCIVTNEMKTKKELIRIVLNKEGKVFVDPAGKENGRGAYLSLDSNVIEKAKQTNALGRQLKTEIDPAIYDELLQLVEGSKQ